MDWLETTGLLALGVLLLVLVALNLWLWLRQRRPRPRAVGAPVEMKTAPSPAAVRGFPWLATILLTAGILACAVYANLAFTVTNPANFRYFPPFKPNENAAKGSRHLGGEYFQMAQSLVAGQGFSHPFDRPTGPTAWQPPVLPLILAGFLWACDGSRDGVMAIVIVLQVLILVGTGVLVLALVQQTSRRIGAGVAAGLFFLALLCDFNHNFQWTHDSWLVMLAVDLLIAGLCWCRPLHGWPSALGWGLFGGLCALINPIVGLTWGVLSVLTSFRQCAWSHLGLAVLAAFLVLTPWTVRNFLVFGRFIPTKSNLAYEMYQTQCLQPEGLLRGSTFRFHPYGSSKQERPEYNQLGEIGFLDRKWQQFWQSVWSDPLDYLDRVAERFLGATLWYVPFWDAEARRTWSVWCSRLTHPLPFLGLVILLLLGVRERLHPAQWIVIGVYLLYLLPYIGLSYYDRYGVPLLGAKVLLLLWAADRLLSLPWRQPALSSRKQGRDPASGRRQSPDERRRTDRPPLARSS